MKFPRNLLTLCILCTLALNACAAPAPTETENTPAEAETGAEPEADLSAADLAAVKDYAIDQAEQMTAASAKLAATAQHYYDLIASHDFDYQAAWEADDEELAGLIATAKDQWLVTSQHYELNEGIVAGVPSLAYYDVWIDAGPSAEEDPAEALEWELALPDGRVLASPGNFFHHLTEPAIWVTNPEFTGLAVDLDGNGEIEFAEGLPEANVFLGAAQGLDAAGGEMLAAINAWEPTLSDAFTALAVMVPTMNEYFEQWKLSSYVTGDSTEEANFVAVSRLFDINGILHGLDVTYENVGVVVDETNPELHAQIDSNLGDLVAYVSDLYAQEQGGKVFTPEEADLFGTEAQDQATAISGQVSQAASLLAIEIQE
jgi:hypothetical protein